MKEKPFVEMRDLSGYKPSELDVASLIKNEINEEIASFGKAFYIRVYPTSYMLKLAEQVGEKYDRNYVEINFNGDLYIVGSNAEDEEFYCIENDLTRSRLTSITKSEREEALKKGHL